MLYESLVDSHFHLLSMKEKGVDVDALLTSLFSEGFFGGIDVAVDASDFKERYELVKNYPSVFLSAGEGPWGLEDGKRPITETLTIIENTIQELGEAVKFIGEIGLDNHYDTYGTKKDQEEFFISEIELANAYNLPIIIHSREAVGQTVDIIKTHRAKNAGILHCFSGSEYLLKAALDEGYYISFAGPMTYKNSTNLQEMLKLVPLSRILLETDSPYLPPFPLRGTVNTPENMPLIYKRVSEILNIPHEKLAETVKENFKTLMKIA